MCGIIALANIDETLVDRNLFTKLSSCIDHRGPDGQGYWSQNNISIGHKRLKIIDLTENGAQPMFSNNKRYILSFNGEIYNFKKLKKILIQKGYSFKSKTDSEVVVNSFQEWGLDSLKMFNGMFAFIIWDQLKNEFIVSRDRYGIKPLYYFKNEKIMMFSSEIKPIINHPYFEKKINFNALDEYFTFQNNLKNETLFEGICMLEQGSYLIYNNQSKDIKKKKFWDYNFCEDHSISREEAVEEVDRLFNISVESQLMSDVELGSYLSGGMDSGAITAIASKKISNLKTFTIGYNMSSISGLELAYDERKKAKYLSDLNNTDHYEAILDNDDMESCLSNLVNIIENPVVGQSYPNYYAAQLAKKHVTVVFSGAGGDEIFAGYPWRYQYSSDNKSPENFIEKYYGYWSRILQDKDKKTFYNNSFYNSVNCNSFESFKDKFNYNDFSNSHEDYINKSLKFECETFLQGLLILEDKISMSFGLESRVPFLDNDLVDFAMNIPIKFKLNNLVHDVTALKNNRSPIKNKFYSTTNDGKIVLRKVFEKYVTKEYSKNKKQGFSGPDGSWFKGQSINFIERIIKDKNASMYEYLDYKGVLDQVNLHLEGKENKRLLIWSLINFEYWLNIYLKVK